MINFKNDYNKIAHRNILEAMLKYSDEPNVGYGLDEHSKNAANLIKQHLNSDADVHFLVGGTSANKVVISHVLKPYEAVISVKTGHICVHETGAIEATGHKIIAVDGVDGKITPQEIENVVLTHTDEHMVLPRMVYITQATEIGTLYTKEELIQIHNICKKHNLYLFLDGARLAVGLDKSDITLADLAQYTDVFYIGGTKNGALLGEAIVITNDDIKKCFRYSIKQNGGMYAKGFVAGIQFEELFKDGQYFKLGHNSNEMAEILAKGLEERNILLEYKQVTNQLFVRVSNELYNKLPEFVLFELWEDKGLEKVVRFVTNFSTTEEEIRTFFNELDNIIR
jgi:threonine aldolase